MRENFVPTERILAGHLVRKRQRLGDSQASTPLDHHQESCPGIGCSSEQGVYLVGLDVLLHSIGDRFNLLIGFLRILPAGYSVPLRLTVRQERYCRRAVGITRFIHNLGVATHPFCCTNRMPGPHGRTYTGTSTTASVRTIPFVTEVAARV